MSGGLKQGGCGRCGTGRNPDDNQAPSSCDGTGIAVREVLCRIGDKWSLYVICHLANEPLRFNELKRSIEGISQRMLTLTLRSLERDGLVTRTVYGTMPPRVDYELTELGRTLAGPVRTLLSWAEKHRVYIECARRHFDGENQKFCL